MSGGGTVQIGRESPGVSARPHGGGRLAPEGLRGSQ